MVGRWSKAEIAILRRMAARGLPGTVIAVALNRTALSVRVKAVELGVRLRPLKMNNEIRFDVTDKVRFDLDAKASALGFQTRARLCRALVAIASEDGLISGIIDAEPLGRAAAADAASCLRIKVASENTGNGRV